MPFTWTPESERRLLLTIIESQGFKFNANKVAEMMGHGLTANAINKKFKRLRTGMNDDEKSDVPITPKKRKIERKEEQASAEMDRDGQENGEEED